MFYRTFFGSNSKLDKFTIQGAAGEDASGVPGGTLYVRGDDTPEFWRVVGFQFLPIWADHAEPSAIATIFLSDGDYLEVWGPTKVYRAKVGNTLMEETRIENPHILRLTVDGKKYINPVFVAGDE